MNWFASWFDSPYYHILYQHRNEEEAAFFISNLTKKLALPKSVRILDLACGKGRHSVYLNSLGYEVVGADLAAESIAAAKPQENDRLSFVVHDMRQPLDMGDFDAVFNLFTSFGYFETEAEHLQTLHAARTLIEAKQGVFVMDFMNAYKTIQNLVLKEDKAVDGILFKLRRYVENGYIVKDIRFEDRGKAYHFQERVRAFQLANLQPLFEQAGLQIEQTFGNYALAPFEAPTSDRLIIVAQPC